MIQVQLLDVDELRPNPTGHNRPARPAIRPPAHRIPQPARTTGIRRYQEVCEQIAKHTGVDYVWLMTGQDRRHRGG